MATRPEDVESAFTWATGEVRRRERGAASATSLYGVIKNQADANHLRTILASHAELTKNLQRRDDFIVDRGLWPDFVDQLPSGKASA